MLHYVSKYIYAAHTSLLYSTPAHTGVNTTHAHIDTLVQQNTNLMQTQTLFSALLGSVQPTITPPDIFNTLQYHQQQLLAQNSIFAQDWSPPELFTHQTSIVNIASIPWVGSSCIGMRSTWCMQQHHRLLKPSSAWRYHQQVSHSPAPGSQLIIITDIMNIKTWTKEPQSRRCKAFGKKKIVWFTDNRIYGMWASLKRLEFWRVMIPKYAFIFRKWSNLKPLNGAWHLVQ